MAMRNFHEGDPVRAIVLKVDSEKRQISLGLKPSYFAEDDAEEPAEESLEIDVSKDSSEDIVMEPVGDEVSESDEDSEEIEVDEEALRPAASAPVLPAPAERPVPQLVPALSLTGGFQWQGNSEESSDSEKDSDDSEDDDDEKTTRKKKKKKRAIEYDLTGKMHTKVPDSVSDFERRLLGSPDSSYLWIQYMSFQLQLSEIDKAREIGRRALRTINLREELEKLNIWIAMLNLENSFGTEESLESAFREAARMCDSKTVHLRLATILSESQKHEVSFMLLVALYILISISQKAEAQYKRTCKKFGQSSKVWTSFAEFYLRRGQAEEARSLLPRSMQSLEKRKRKAIVKELFKR